MRSSRSYSRLRILSGSYPLLVSSLSFECVAPRRDPAVPTEQPPISDDRHEQHRHAQADLHAMREPWWIDQLDQIVINESPGVAGFASTTAQIVLEQRKRTSEGGELDQCAVRDSWDVHPDDPGPSPGEKGAGHNERDE
jgi:hypothetical protein